MLKVYIYIFMIVDSPGLYLWAFATRTVRCGIDMHLWRFNKLPEGDSLFDLSGCVPICVGQNGLRFQWPSNCPFRASQREARYQGRRHQRRRHQRRIDSNCFDPMQRVKIAAAADFKAWFRTSTCDL